MNNHRQISSALAAENGARNRAGGGGHRGVVPFAPPQPAVPASPSASPHSPLFSELLHHAADQASAMTTALQPGRLVDSIADDGLSMTERLEHSPHADDQLLAVALRLRMGLSRCDEIADALDAHFGTPPSSFAVEAQRRTVMAALGGQGLPLDAAAHAAARIGRQGAEALAAHAALYAELWCDPRIGATIAARQMMLAMVSALQERCLAPRLPAHSRSRRRS